MAKFSTSRIALVGVMLAAPYFSCISLPANAAEPPKAQSALTVEIVFPTQHNWPLTVKGSGEVTAWQDAVISSEVGGLKIKKILVDVGSKVKKGETLAQLSQASTLIDIQKQEAELAEAKANYALAKANANSAKKVKGKGSLSDQKITEYLIAEQTARAQVLAAKAELADSRLTLKNTTLTAVDDGVITSKSAILGDVVSIGDELFRMQRQGIIEWHAELDTQQIVKVQDGQPAILQAPDGNIVKGHVRTISPALDSTTGRGTVYVQLDHTNHVQAGSYVLGTITVGEKTAMTIPETALVYRDGRTYVFSVSSDNRVQQHVVKTGRRRNNEVEVLSGLKASWHIVKAGGAFLTQNATVQIKSEGNPS